MDKKIVTIIAVIVVVAIVAVAAFVLLNNNKSGGGGDDDDKKAENVPCDPYTVTDLAGQVFTLDHTLGAVATQWSISGGPFITMTALLGDDVVKYLVGMDATPPKYRADAWEAFCNNIPGLSDLEIIGGIGDDFDATKVLTLKPNALIISKDQKTAAENAGVVDVFKKANIPVIYVDFHSQEVQKSADSIRLIGKLFGKEKEANELASYYENKCNGVYDRVKAILNAGAERPLVHIECAQKGPEQMGNSYSNHYMWGGLLYNCGGEPLFSGTGNDGSLDPAYVLASNPDKILFTGSLWPTQPKSILMGFTATEQIVQDRTDAYFEERAGWKSLDAYIDNEVYTIYHSLSRDAYDYVAIEYIAKMLWPEEFQDLNPVKDLQDFYKKYMGFNLYGTWMYHYDNGGYVPPEPTYDNPDLILIDSDIQPVLEAYGNVNADAVIDSKDVELLKKVLEDGTASLYPYADANFDGTVNWADVGYLQSIIDATDTNKVAVKVFSRINATNAYITEIIESPYTGETGYYTVVDVPNSNIATSASANIILMMKYLDIVEQIKGVAYSGTIDFGLYPEYQYLFADSKTPWAVNGDFLYRIGDSAMYVSKELLTEHVVNDKVSLLISADNKSYLTYSSSKKYGMTEPEIQDLGVGVVRIGSAFVDLTMYYSNLATLAFVVGVDTAKLQEMVEWSSNTVYEMNEVLHDFVGEGYVKEMNMVVSSSASYTESSDGKVENKYYVSASAEGSDYTDFVEKAGGFFALYDYPFTSSSAGPFDDCGLWLNAYDIDKIIIFKTGSGFSYLKGEATTTDAGIKAMKSCLMAFKDTECYYNNDVYVVAGDMPILLRTIFSAVVLYPDLFTEDWANDLYKDYAKKFLGVSESDMQNIKFFVTMEDVGLSGH